MEQLIEISNRLLKSPLSSFTRSLYTGINWQNRLIEIKGARGVGKTTLMLQRAKRLLEQGIKPLYLSLDNAFFYGNQLFETVDTFCKYGGTHIFIDEVHRYPRKEKGLDWSQEIKNVYDSFPDLNIVYSGSSILQLYQGQGDLSRRKSGYRLNGLSFREFLELNGRYRCAPLSLDEILADHQNLCNEITSSIKILPAFNEYLKFGYYPFYNEAPDIYFNRLNDVINVILETDIPSVSDIGFETSYKLKKLLFALTSSAPYAPNLSNLSSQLYIADHRTLIRYINFLEKAELLNTLGAKATGNQILNKPQKVYLNNANLMFAIGGAQTNKGTLRETFFLNQMKVNHDVVYPKVADFMVDNTYTFEVGGKGKNLKQIANIAKGYLASDDIETGFGNTIPLWLFGFLY